MILHVACLPFPSYQGTQAALAAMLGASARAGRDTHVLTYAHGAYPLEAPYTVHRIADFPRVRSLRSGPSLGKLALDARCIAATRALADTLRPDAVIAHHVEAALAARVAGVEPLHYVAHTTLETELSVYFRRLPEPILRTVGRTVDRLVVSLSHSTAAVAPSLAGRLGEGVVHLPVPWPSRLAENRASSSAVILYAGNLDAYQGWETLMQALPLLRQLEADARLLVASESDPTPARREAMRRGVSSSVEFRRLDGEEARARVHADSDLAWIPRRTEGGLPIKMLDAFARGLPVIATERAIAGLPVGDACHVIPDDDPVAFAHASYRLLGDARARRMLVEAAYRYLETHHDEQRFLSALDLLLDRGSFKPAATPSARRPLAEPALRAR